MEAIMRTPLFWFSVFSPATENINPSVQFGTTLRDGSVPPLIPRDVLMADDDYSYVKISPNGQWISYLAPVNGIKNIFLAELSQTAEPLGPLPSRQLTNETEQSIQGYQWLYDNHSLTFTIDSAGDENYQIQIIDIITNQQRVLAAHEGVRAFVWETSEMEPTKIIIGMNQREPSLFDPYIVDLVTLDKTRLFVNDKFLDITFDHKLQPRIGMAPDPQTGDSLVYLNDVISGKGWEEFRRIPYEDVDSTQPVAIDKSGQFMYWLDSTLGDKTSLVETKFSTKMSRTLYTPSKGDTEKIFTDSTTGKPAAALTNYDKQEYVFFEDQLQQEYQMLKKPGSVMLIKSKDQSFNKWIIAYRYANQPTKFYLYNRQKRSLTLLLTSKPALSLHKLSNMKPVEITTRDGLIMLCYLSLPFESEPNPRGYLNNPLPMVLFVHGGPWDRDSWEFDKHVQLMTNRGYAVLQCNFRGSSGFGKAFLNAGDGQWSKKMHDDLIDGVNWIIKQGIADQNRIAIMGGSYGGYSALVGLTYTPNVFACGVDIVGPSNLITLLGSVPPYWKPMLAKLKKRIGADPDTLEGRDFLRSISPVFRAAEIKKPLLIGQGANDPRVNIKESEQVVDAMKTNGFPVTYIVFPDEGHGFHREENKKAFTAVYEHFLSRCLGGRAEAMRPVKGTSMKVEDPGELEDVLTNFSWGRHINDVVLFRRETNVKDQP